MRLRISCMMVGILSLALSLLQLTFAQTRTETTSALPQPASGMAEGQAGSALPAAAKDVTTTGGTADHLPIFNGTSTVIDSIVSQSGTTLDVTGAVAMPATNSTGTEGVLAIGNMLLHNYGPTGSDNAFLGYKAGNFHTTGSFDTGTGYAALVSNTTGADNTATGAYTLSLNTTGHGNSAVGFGALNANTTGIQNEAFGIEALVANTTGSGNAAFGGGALAKNTTGGSSATTGGNSAFGNFALNTSSTAGGNSAFGYSALTADTTGNNNVAVGVDALGNNTTGAENTAVGVGACLSNTTGTGHNCFGYDTDVVGQNLHNATAIGAHAIVKVSDAIVLGSVAGVNGATTTTRIGIGTTSPTNLLTLGQGFGPSIADGWATYSSRRWKTNIQTLHGALEKVERLRGVSYDLKANGQHEVGVIAEEVGAVVPELVTYEANGKDARSVDYSRLTALLIEATKEQQALIRQQQKLIRAQETQLRSQQAEIRAAQTQSSAQQTQISQLASQIQTIQVSLSSSRPDGVEIRTASLRTAPRQ